MEFFTSILETLFTLAVPKNRGRSLKKPHPLPSYPSLCEDCPRKGHEGRVGGAVEGLLVEESGGLEGDFGGFIGVDDVDWL